MKKLTDEVIRSKYDEARSPFVTFDAWEAYCQNFEYQDPDCIDVCDADEAFVGEFDNDAKFGMHIADCSGDFNNVPESLQPYIDWDYYARDMLLGDYFKVGTYYFRSI